MFRNIPQAPPDSILGITEAFNKDANPSKINLSVGVYKDESGKTPVLACVKAAEERLLKSETTKNYIPIEGTSAYGQCVRELLFGADHPVIAQQRAVTAHAPGGTGALRVAADFLARCLNRPEVWISDPTWPNHPSIFQAAGLKTQSYPYFDAARNDLAFTAMMQALGQAPQGSAVVLHGCCHNPTGVDPTPQQWQQIADLCRQRNFLPVVDFAYQGLGLGLTQDAVGLSALVNAGLSVLVASSFSKNFGLYNERVGALTAVTADAAQAQCVLSQIKVCVRANYSNPPAHGGAIVTTILSDAALRQQWFDELQAMRQRIQRMRELFVQTLAAKGVKRDMSFIVRQKGMFSFSGLTKEQVERLKKEFGLYIVGSGRINVAGMTTSNMSSLCDSIVKVM